MPIGEAEAKAVLERALAAAKADEVEAWLSGGSHALTRFAENTIHQNVKDRTLALTVRAAFGKRTARADTNRLDDEGVRSCVANAERLARVSPEDPELLPVVPGPQKYEAVEAFDAATAASTPEGRADAVKEVVARCLEAGAKAAGAYEVVDGEVGEYGEMGTVA